MVRKLSYKSSGVDINKANTFVKAISANVKSTQGSAVLKRKGVFGGLFALSASKNSVLVSSTDGVGTKLLLAKELNKHDTVGIDLVAMNVNDILCVGAKPLFFLDYIACGKLNVKKLKSVVKGISKGCREAGCALVGGETAEMPGMYKDDDYDLAGFAVGVVEKKNIIDGSAIKTNDIVIGLPSSGVHSNGYSLVRKVFSSKQKRRMKNELLKPTKIYVREVLPLISKFKINGIAHITGGAFYEKLTKILPKGKCFQIDRGSWQPSKIFQKIQKQGKIQDREMFRTFNMGIGLALVVSRNTYPKVKSYLKGRRIRFYEIGKVINRSDKKIIL